MKYNFITLLFLISASTVFAQEINFYVHGAYQRPVKEGMLNNGKTLSDICTGYPAAWINNYQSTEITVTSNGTTMKASGNSHSLTEEQRAILKKADMGTEVIIVVNYTYPNSVTGTNDPFNMKFPLTYIPDVEAQFTGGKNLLRQYLKEHTVNKIPPSSSKNLKPATVRFTIDENGKIAKAIISDSSGDTHIDALLLEAINKMPDWTPALNSKGKTTNQDFIFSFGNQGC